MPLKLILHVFYILDSLSQLKWFSNTLDAAFLSLCGPTHPEVNLELVFTIV